MTDPNFFIVGAPKCGTTALARYLAEHPNVFLSTPKEPNYFARHLTLRTMGDVPAHEGSIDGYHRLFRNAPSTAHAVGEASTRYLRSVRALNEIRGRYPTARLVAMVRNPVELVFSWHAQKLYEGQESEKDPFRAWELQRERAAGRSLPGGLRTVDALYYGRVARVGSQIQRLQRMFPRSRVLVVFLDDMRVDPRQVYRTVLDHLGLEDDGRTDFPVVNRRRNVRWPWIQALVREPPTVARPIVRFARRIYRSSEGLRTSWQQLRDDGGLDATRLLDLRRDLSIVFEPEILKLEGATGRDLSSWRVRS